MSNKNRLQHIRYPMMVHQDHTMNPNKIWLQDQSNSYPHIIDPPYLDLQFSIPYKIYEHLEFWKFIDIVPITNNVIA